MKKRITGIILSFMMIFSFISSVQAYEYNSDTVTVYVTVNDITDVDEPLNTLITHRPLTVSNFDISEYGEQFTGIEILDSGVTYLHVLIALHEELYGKEAVSEYLKIDSNNITRIFMGRSVGSIMYKNGRYIFAVPNYINVYDGDEVNICLYDEGYNQAIASFDEAYINAETGGTLDLNLFMHHWYPESSEPIEGAEIVDGNGVYVTDSDGNIITTDADGDFSITFPKKGLYRLTIAPTLGYYMSNSGGTWIVWYEEVEITETVEKERTEWQTNATAKAVQALAETENVKTVFVTNLDDWLTDDDSTASENTGSFYYGDVFVSGAVQEDIYNTVTYTEDITRTELIKHEEFVSGEATQKVDYTTPWVVVNVTDELTVTDASMNDKSVTFKTINSGRYTGTAYCAGYDSGNPEVPAEVKLTSFNESMTFNFAEAHDKYKLYVWDNTMKPAGQAYAYNPQSAAAAWNFTRTAPENVIITGE